MTKAAPKACRTPCTLHLPGGAGQRHKAPEQARQAFAVESTDCGALVGHLLEPTWSFTNVLAKTRVSAGVVI